MANDIFMEIAKAGAGGRKELLHEPQPMPHETLECILSEPSSSPVPTVKKMDTKAELNEELKRLREAFRPFLKNCAPEAESYRKRIDLKEFLFCGNEKVTIPHYGGPIGYAVHTYETDFSLSDFENKTVYFCSDGADYKAEVMINGEFAGCHEGFFSPFEFDITELVKNGDNKLKIVLKNDYIYNGFVGERLQGDKLYAATGIGWDDPETGWHHCPPGLGLYNNVYIEIREKNHIHDLFVRPLVSEKRIEAWVEVENTEYIKKDYGISLSVYGSNFEETIFENKLFLTKDLYKFPAQKGTNIYKISIPMENFRLWDTDSPYLYTMNARLLFEDEVTDTASVKFGMREFTQDIESNPKGLLRLNGKKVRLRGANTMGFEQLDVMHGDFDRLIDDILLAKICNMNYLRITQRPVQSEVYDYCDMLGIMVQTDLPLFGCMRRTKVAEAVRQAEEMERLIRNHPSCVMVTYINEPCPEMNAQPHRHLEREELEEFFGACNMIVHLNNPDRVIKHVDGDFNPPTGGMPDIHCYTGWYNGHEIDIGRLIKGYNVKVKPGWYYGCGEYGAEGLEDSSVMKKYYPEDWLKEPFDPGRIVLSQTADMHYNFFDTQDSLEDWIRESQKYQALATKLMTDAYRRDRLMLSSVIHLFIDAWPSGWMKTIMDCERNPKPAYFTYRNCLEPIKLSLRTDRFTYTSGEKIAIECYLCNDTNLEADDYTVVFELYRGDRNLLSGKASAIMKDCDISYIADATFTAPDVCDREKFTLKAILTDNEGRVITYETQDFEVFSDVEVIPSEDVELIFDLPEGVHEIAGEKVTVKKCSMGSKHFVSRKTGHKAVSEFLPKDFSYWYNKQEDMITPILCKTFEAEGFTTILSSGNTDDKGVWHKVHAVAAKEYNGKLYVISQVDLRQENPVAKRLLKNIYEYKG